MLFKYISLGIYYWNGNRNASSLLNDDDSTNMNFKDYINYQRNVLYKNSMAMTLSFTGQNVLYKVNSYICFLSIKSLRCKNIVLK